MKNCSVEIKPASAADILALHGKLPGETVRAVAVYYHGELAAVAGVTVERDRTVAFSEIREGVTAPKLTVWRVAKEVMQFITNTSVPVIAGPSENFPNAAKFLERLGFEPTQDKEVYLWHH